MKNITASWLILATACCCGEVAAQGGPTLANPVMFVTQVPIPADFATIGSVFANHEPSMKKAARGGDLWIRYTDGTLRNLTQEAGLGNAGFQGPGSIAVRDPCVHWDGNRAVFAMAVGAPAQQYAGGTWYWQLYEITGFGQGETVAVTQVPHQPQTANNVNPAYGSDDRILFASDWLGEGRDHLRPLRDEYESTAVVSGIFSLNPTTGHTRSLVSTPSGAYTPMVDSYGRVIFTQWDHLQRDQQADAVALGYVSPSVYSPFNWASEQPGASATSSVMESFPEPRHARVDLLAGTNMRGHTLNHFFPWMMNQDGTQHETLNHVGRHELHNYFDMSINGDPALGAFAAINSGRTNPNSIVNMLQIEEDPTIPGRYYGIDAPEFQTHASGQIVRLDAPPGLSADQIVVTYVTHRDTHTVTASPGPNHSGHYREATPLVGGDLIAVHAAATAQAANLGTTASPIPRYDFRLKMVDVTGPWGTAGAPLTGGISKSISYYNPDVLVTWTGNLWELNPVEVRARPRPAMAANPVQAPEQAAFTQAGVSVPQFTDWLQINGLALIVSRDVTTRDDADLQQPVNLRIAGTSTQTTSAGGATGPVHDVSHLQLFTAELIRGYTGGLTGGRRSLATPMDATLNNPTSGGPAGSVTLGADGSMAAIVPARRPLSWQLTDPAGTPVIRERYWLSFQPGEIRTCTSCHGVNEVDQAGLPEPTNTPQALVDLLMAWNPPVPSSLGPAGAGAVGEGAAGPTDVFHVNGSAGGPSRRVDVGLGVPINLTINNPSPGSGPAPFLLYAIPGVPTAGGTFPTAFGPLVFPPPHLNSSPLQFSLVLVNGLFSDPLSILGTATAPWSHTFPGFTSPVTFTAQGITVDGTSPNHLLSTTNAVILRVL